MWLGNYRGNTYSRNHTFLNPDDQSGNKGAKSSIHTLSGGFWDFTWDEMAHYDIPAMIEKVLELTGETELFYAGHSMGTTAFMAMHFHIKVQINPLKILQVIERKLFQLNSKGP